MQRATVALLGLGFLAALTGAMLISHDSAKSRGQRSEKPAASALAAAQPASSEAAKASPSAGAQLGADAGNDAGAVSGGDGFDTFPDGGRVPELPNSAPQEVSFGVVQLTHQGSQFAGSDSRTKDQARQKAEALLELALHDFAAAVSKGDRGSTADAGRIPRGVLEAPIEYVLFTLNKHTVHPSVIDTPRGYWIVRRND
jgi:hypothetical protein